MNEKGEYPTRLVIPATNFTATFSKLGYLRIKKMLDKAKVNYSRFTIVQASDLKEKLEEIGVNRDKLTIALIDAVNMYPSIKIKTIKKAVRYFTKGLTAATKKTTNLCLELIRLGMSSTLNYFGGYYYKYHGGGKK